MGIKEKDLEIILLELLEHSDALKEKIKNIAISSKREDFFQKSKIESNFQESIRKLNKQLIEANENLKKYKELYEQMKSENETYKKEITDIKSKNEKLETKCNQYYIKLIEAQNKNEELNSTVDSEKNKNNTLCNELTEAKETIKNLKSQFEVPINYLELYKSLPEVIKEGLANVINDKNEILFISSCTLEDNLKAIWEYTKDMIGNHYKQENIEIMKQIFDYFFDIFNDSLLEPKYLRDTVEIGDYLDDEYYERARGSSTSGFITQVVLRGYKTKNTQKIICKSVVKA